MFVTENYITHCSISGHSFSLHSEYSEKSAACVNGPPWSPWVIQTQRIHWRQIYLLKCM